MYKKSMNSAVFCECSLNFLTQYYEVSMCCLNGYQMVVNITLYTALDSVAVEL